METTLNAVDASYFLWDALWKKDTSSYLSLNILDVVQLTADGAISGWLFTSSQGEVKSKLATNWRLDTMVNRCSYFEKGTIAHHYNVSVRKWMCLTSTDMLASVIGAKNPSRSAVILHPLLNRSTVFMEVDCVKPVYERRIEIPTFTNTWLCDLSAKGMKTKVDSLPTQSIVCKDKESNSLSRDYLTTIIKLLETNLRIKVTHISIVVIFESVPAGPANSTKFGTTVLSSESRIVRLHHISSLTYRAAVQPQSTAGGDSFSTFSDVNSNSVEAASLLSAKPSRVDCCHGDFCLYSAAEEGRNDAAENLEFDENGDFHIQSEALKAVSRHRPVTRNDRFRALAAQAGEEVEDTAEKMDLYPGQTDHLIAASKKEKNTSSSSSFSFNSSSGVLREPNNAYSSDASLRTKGSTFRTQQTLHTQKSKLLQEAVRRTEKKLKVMSKSIALARQEMEELESRDIDHLNSSNDNLSPSSRRKAGKAAAKADPLMAETSTSGSAHSSKIWPSSLVRWWLSTGRNQPKNSLSVMVPSSSAHCISKTVLGNKLTAAAQEASSSPVFRGSTTLPVEVEGPVEQANSLYFGWYYHPVRVCEKCYKVYTELDRYRKLRFKHLIKQQEKSDENDPKKWREIEARIFRQRQFVSRLAKLDTAASAAQHSSHYYQQQAGILGSHSMAFDSVLEGSAQEGVAFGRAYKLNASRSDGQLRASEQNSYRGGVAPPVPSKALPPLPWGLSQQGRSEAYYTGSNSILTNRILQRAPDYAAVGGSYGGSSSGGGGGADNVDAVLQQWRELTSDRSNQYQQDVHPPRNKAAGAKKQNKGSQHGRKGAFNVDRLLHPWQRDMNRMKERLKSGLPLEVEEEEEQGGGGGPDSNGADGSYGDNEDGYGNGNGQGYSSHEGDGGGDDYDDGYSDDRQIHTADHHHQQQNSGSTKSKPTRLQALSAGANAPDKSKGRRGGDKNKKQGLQDQGRGGLLPALQLNSFTSGASTNTTSTTSTTTSTSANTAVPKTSLQQLKRIEASWGTEEPASRGGAVNSSNSNTYSGNSNSSPKKLNPAIITTSTGSSSGSLSSSSGVGDGGGGLQSSAAVNRVGNALLGGLNLPADSNKPLGRVATSESIPEHHEAQISRPPVYPPRAAGGGGAGGDRDGGDDDGDDDEEGSDEEIGWSPFAVRA